MSPDTVAATIILTGNVHSRFLHRPCYGLDQILCYPGASYLSSVIKAIRAREPNVVLLDAGDSIFGSDANYDQTTSVANTINLLQYNAIALGNHCQSRAGYTIKLHETENMFRIVIFQR